MGAGVGGSGGVPGERLPHLLNKVQPWVAGAADVQITQFMSSAVRTSGEEGRLSLCVSRLGSQQFLSQGYTTLGGFLTAARAEERSDS